MGAAPVVVFWRDNYRVSAKLADRVALADREQRVPQLGEVYRRHVRWRWLTDAVDGFEGVGPRKSHATFSVRAADWADLAALAGPGAVLGLAGIAPPDSWPVTPIGDGVQLVGEGVEGAADDGDDGVVRLGPGDTEEMLDLAMRTRPGPFLPRTRELGEFLGIRRGGALVAMAGERLHPPGWTEISGVCTEEGWRGHGFATRLMRVLVAGIRARGETPFLHALASNTGAVRLYESMGFRLRRTITFSAVRVPGP